VLQELRAAENEAFVASFDKFQLGITVTAQYKTISTGRRRSRIARARVIKICQTGKTACYSHNFAFIDNYVALVLN